MFDFGVERFEPKEQNADDNDCARARAGWRASSICRRTVDTVVRVTSRVAIGSLSRVAAMLPDAIERLRKEALMRGLPYSVVLVLGLAQASVMAQASPKEAPVPSALLKLQPTLTGVEFDTPTDEAAISACKVENVLNSEKRSVGYALRDGQGRLLRRFVIAHGGERLDQWSYFQDGFECYREDDLDGDRSLDECRWLNSGGTRIALVAKGKIKAWKQISAEESSKVLVQALVAGDAPLLETVMATPAELAAAGLPKAIVDRVAAAAAKRPEQAAALQKQLVGWNAQTVWNRFDGTFPHVIPADPPSGLEKDITLYENAMVIPGTTGAQQNAAKLAFLQVPDMIQLGATWKFIELPRAIDPEKPIVAVATGLRSMLFERANNVEPRDEATDAALKALADYDTKNAPLLQSGEKEKLARYHVGRVPLLRAVVKGSKNPEEQLAYNKQVVDNLIAAMRTGLYSQGRKPLEAIVAEGGKLASYAAYSLIDADFAMKNDEPGANFVANQKKWMAELGDFLKKFQDADEAPSALFHLANANEFNSEEDEARKQYAKLVEAYAATDAGKKAAGALRRLDLEGKSLVVSGTGLRDEPVDSSKYRGKPVLIVFWASWAKSVKDDLPELIKVYEKYHPRGLEIVGIDLDNDRAELDAFLRENPVSWPQIFEAGGMESRLAVDFGIILLPNMILIDAEGKVVSRNLRNSAEANRQLEKLFAKKPAGIALDPRN
jgi:thiol-disulfide isomerase/thioredoxin